MLLLETPLSLSLSLLTLPVDLEQIPFGAFCHSFSQSNIHMTSNEQQVTLGYLSFIRRQRQQSLLDLTLAFQDISERRVVETTYDSLDVQAILKDSESAVLAIVGNELQLHSHMNVLLLQQLLRQAVGVLHIQKHLH